MLRIYIYTAQNSALVMPVLFFHELNLRCEVVAFPVQCEHLLCIAFHTSDLDGLDGAQDLSPAFILHAFDQLHLAVVHGIASAYGSLGVGVFPVTEKGNFSGFCRLAVASVAGMVILPSTMAV